MAENITVSIVIVNYKTRDYLHACLESILKEREIKYEIIVVDNNSDDGSVEMVRTHFPSALLILNDKNVGFAAANNRAIEGARGKYLLLLNPDTRITRSTLGTLVAFMEDNPDVSTAGCKVLYPDGRIQMSCGRLPTIFSAFFGGETINIALRKIFPNSRFIGACGIIGQDGERRHEVETLLGACVFLRKDILDKIGLFDENMFMYFEECDLFHRIRRAGGKIMYIPDTTIYHHAGASTTTESIGRSVHNYLRSQEYYLKKVFSLKRIGLFRVSLVLCALAKSASISLALLVSGPQRRARLKRKMLWHWHTCLYYFKMPFSSYPARSGKDQPQSV